METKRFIQKIKNIYHLIKAFFANVYFGFPSRDIFVIGVTGTNGKTTTVQMITRILEESGRKVAMSSTINFKVGNKEWANDTKFTTRSAWSVQSFIKKAVKEKCQYLVLEVSSHSLDQNRIWGTFVDEAVITNITREHLDYHHTMENYAKAKAKLFKMTSNNRKRKINQGVLNNDLSYFQSFIFKNMQYYLYGIKENKNDKLDFYEEFLFPEKINLKMNSSEFILGGVTFNLNLPGEVNVENALASIAVAKSRGVKLETSAQALNKINLVSGRMESVANKRGLNVIIDYALTPDSMEKLGSTLRDSTKDLQKIIWVFGSCGDRDRGKRPIMGEIASKFADMIILTNEDPYNEDPKRIIREIKKGIKNKKENENFWVIMDRKEAIRKAVSLARKGDTVLITGKGAEQNMMIKGKKLSWNDKRAVKEVLNSFEKDRF
ncbi:MAG: UDP-N-acetylmuramoyl-L-alanyl-D-glutamate--2,6-diaminopimelate ligase [Patescibacteria group bacterium]